MKLHRSTSLPTVRQGARRGSFARGCAVAAGAFVLFAFVVGGCGVGKYNGIVTSHERIDAAFGEIQNQYKRRFDLVPQLVETVKGAADFEQSTITAVTEARASVGRVQLGGQGLPQDTAQLEAFFKAQSGLGSALQRLLVVAENYPTLKASANFLSLQDQLEGNENRIAVARHDYIEAVRAYNTQIRKFPDNLLASTFSFEPVPQLEFEEGVEARPDVNFDFGKKD